MNFAVFNAHAVNLEIFIPVGIITKDIKVLFPLKYANDIVSVIVNTIEFHKRLTHSFNTMRTYRVSQKTPKTIENYLLLEFQCLALN